MAGISPRGWDIIRSEWGEMVVAAVSGLFSILIVSSHFAFLGPITGAHSSALFEDTQNSPYSFGYLQFLAIWVGCLVIERLAGVAWIHDSEKSCQAGNKKSPRADETSADGLWRIRGPIQGRRSAGYF
jgi:hypothetical protein